MSGTDLIGKMMDDVSKRNRDIDKWLGQVGNIGRYFGLKIGALPQEVLESVSTLDKKIVNYLTDGKGRESDAVFEHADLDFLVDMLINEIDRLREQVTEATETNRSEEQSLADERDQAQAEVRRLQQEIPEEDSAGHVTQTDNLIEVLVRFLTGYAQRGMSVNRAQIAQLITDMQGVQR